MEHENAGVENIPNRAAWLAIAGAMVFVIISILLRFFRPEFSLLSDFESDYGNGEKGWLMGIAFLVRSALLASATLALSLGVQRGKARAIGIFFIIFWTIGSSLLAIFPDDLRGEVVTFHGRAHNIIAAVSFLSSLCGTLALTMAFRKVVTGHYTARALLLIWIVSFLGLVCMLIPSIRAGLIGLFERILIFGQLLWVVVSMAALIRMKKATE